MTAPRVLFRADASLAIGSGHVMRSLSLAQALRARGAEVHFASRLLPGHLHAAIASQGFTLHALPAPGPAAAPRRDLAHGAWLAVGEAQDRDETAAVLARLGGVAALIVDHYALDRRWQAPLRAHAEQIAVIDDLADRDHDADLLLDQNLFADAQRRYAGRLPAGCVQLLGPRYALLRGEFAAARSGLRSRDGRLRRVLVFLGGVDANGYTGLAIEALARIEPPLQADVVLGPANPHAQRLAARCAELGFHCAIGAGDMARRMAEADLAIGAGGSTSWERACLGLPTLLLVIADNQRAPAQALAAAGAAQLFEAGSATPAALAAALDALRADPARLAAMAQAAGALVDGHGAGRVARAILPPAISLRRAVESDREPLHHWRNDPAVRAQSHDSAPIARETHDRWFSRVLTDPRRDLLIAEHEGTPVGVLRYDAADTEALVSIYLVPGAAGQGHGPAILRAGSRWLAAQRPQLARIRAEVLPGNAASHKAFAEAGYTLQDNDYVFALKP